MKDEILDQVWRTKDALAKKYGYNVRTMAKELQQREKASKAGVVNLHDLHVGRVCEEPAEYRTKREE